MFGFSLSRSALVCTYAAVSLLVVSPSYVYSQDYGIAPPVEKSNLPKSDPNEIYLYFCTADGGHKNVLRMKSDLGFDDKATSVKSATPEQQLIIKIAHAVAAGPTQNEKIAGARSALPIGSTLDNVEVISAEDCDHGVRLYLTLPAENMTPDKFNWKVSHDIGENFIESLRDYNVCSFDFRIFNHEAGEYQTPRQIIDGETPKMELPPTPDTDAVPEPDVTTKLVAPPVATPGQNPGALSGKSVILNQSHGWYWSGSRYYIQRSKLFECLEDFSSAEFMNLNVLPALMNAGAQPKPVREPDHQTNMVLVDNADGAPNFTKTGSWTVSTATGFTKKTSYVGQLDNPFGAKNTSEYSSSVLNQPTATATFTLNVTTTGYYNVYVTFSSGSNRTTDAHYRVRHSGGDQEFRIDQTKNGGTWLLLGNFYFEAGAPVEQRSIVVSNDSKVAAGKIVTVDAVRIGGGVGDTNRREGGVSGRPRWQEDAMHYLHYTGYINSSLYYTSTSSNDMQLGWTHRPRFAQWEQVKNADGANTIYVGWHTNASSGGCNDDGTEKRPTAVGSGIFRDVDADATQGTKNLATALHNGFLSNIRAFYKSDWYSRGTTASNNYGECNQNHLGSVSGAFFEGLFHDNPAETARYKDPKFRAIMARGIVQGIISYYGGTVFPPEPPVSFRVTNIGNNQVRLNWSSGPIRTASLPYGSAATSYRIYKSTNGFGFDSGTDVGNTNNTILTLTPGEVAFFRVVASNAGGISFPTETLGVGVPAANNTKAPVLIVNGFDRFDQYLAPITSATNIGGCSQAQPGTWRNIDYRRFNSFNYAVQHGKAIAAAGHPFDSTCNELINNGTVDMKQYPIVDWIGGQEAEVDTGDNVNDEAFTAAEVVRIQEYLTYGGRLFVSNSKLGWDFGRSAASSTKRNFYTNYLKATFVAEKANVTASTGSGTGIFSGLGTLNFNGDLERTYNPEACVISPTGGAVTAMTFSGGSYSGQPSAIQFSGQYPDAQYTSRLVNMSYGFETIRNESTRNAVMARILNYFTSIPPTEDRYFVPDTSGIQRWNNYE